MLKVHVNFPDDMSLIIEKIVDIQTDKLMNEYNEDEIEAVIKYLENNLEDNKNNINNIS